MGQPEKKKYRLAILLLAVLIPTTVFVAGIIFVSSSASSASGKKPPTGSGPDGAAGFGKDGGLASETQSQLLADLKAQQQGTAYYFVSAVYGSSGSTAGQWNFENKNTTVSQQAVLYECTTRTSYQKQSDGSTKKIVTDTPTVKIGETPIVEPGQHSSTVLWFQPITGQTRLICSKIYSYKQLSNGQYSEVSQFFAQNLTLNIQ